MTRSPDQPLIAIADERDRSDECRRRLTRERCETMELALEHVGFSPGTVYWSVAMLVARVSTGWRPLERPLADFADDRAVQTKGKTSEARQRSVKRALDELQAFGLLTWSAEEMPARRRGRRPKVLTIQLNRSAIIAEAEGKPIPLTVEIEAENAPPVGSRIPDNEPDSEPDNGPDKSRTTDRTTDRTNRVHPSSSLKNPKNPGPLSKPAVDGMDQISLGGKGIGDPVECDGSDVGPTAARICDGLGWPRGNLRSVWQVAAALRGGLLSEHAVFDAVAAARARSDRDPVGYFRRVLENNHTGGGEGLRSILGRVRMRGGFPAGPPVRRRDAASPAARPTFQRVADVPRRDYSDAAVNERRNSHLAALAEMIAAEKEVSR